MRAKPILTAALLLSCVPAADAKQPDAPYLAPAQVPDGVAILPPPSAPGSATAEADRELFLRTRRLAGSARWMIATEDAENAPLDRYACAMGMALTPASAPAVAHLLDKAGTGAMVDAVKTRYHSPRPYLGTDAPICQPRTAHLAANGDYPSGHAANGWLEALILATLVPDRSTQILTRARQYGESRIVCGVHSRSAVEAGWMAGSAAFATLMGGSKSFQPDLKRAADELASIRHGSARPDPRRCAAEAAALATPLQ
jgi:acid phosphatase (class A)